MAFVLIQRSQLRVVSIKIHGSLEVYTIIIKVYIIIMIIITTRQVTRATHVRTRVCPWVELILKIIIILLIIFLGFIKSKPC